MQMVCERQLEESAGRNANSCLPVSLRCVITLQILLYHLTKGMDMMLPHVQTIRISMSPLLTSTYHQPIVNGKSSMLFLSMSNNFVLV